MAETVGFRAHDSQPAIHDPLLIEPIETYAQDVVDTVREPLLILDSTLRVHSANRAFYRISRRTARSRKHVRLHDSVAPGGHGMNAFTGRADTSLTPETVGGH